MKIILLTTILTLQLFAINPKVYAVLGDKIYDNLDKIEALQYTREFKGYKKEIKEYVFEVKALKGIGFMIDKNEGQVSNKEYLQELRKLSKTNDFFVQSVKRNFQKSMKDENSVVFRVLLTSGLIDTNRNKYKIKKYYYSHSDEIDIEGTVIEKFVAEDKKKKKKVYRGPTKEELQRARIERIRAKDKAKQEAISKALEEELKRKKEKIREIQKKELKTK